MGPIGNRYLQGSPILPYANVKAYQGADVLLDVEFVDLHNVPVIPTSIMFEMDDLSNAQLMLGPMSLSPGGSTSVPVSYPAFAATWYVQIAGAATQMTFPYQGSQICQLKFNFTGIDSVTGAQFNSPAAAIIELCSLATVSGSF